MQQHEASGEKVQILDIYFYYLFIYSLKLGIGNIFGNTKTTMPNLSLPTLENILQLYFKILL